MKKGGLKLFEPWIGKYDLELSHAWFLENMDVTQSGKASFEWFEDAFVIFKFGIGDLPGAVCMIGYSDSREGFELFYHDTRDVSRIFTTEFDGKTLLFHREDNDFYQRFKAERKGRKIFALTEVSEDKGKTWRKDFDLTFTNQ